MDVNRRVRTRLILNQGIFRRGIKEAKKVTGKKKSAYKHKPFGCSWRHQRSEGKKGQKRRCDDLRLGIRRQDTCSVFSRANQHRSIDTRTHTHTCAYDTWEFEEEMRVEAKRLNLQWVMREIRQIQFKIKKKIFWKITHFSVLFFTSFILSVFLFIKC